MTEIFTHDNYPEVIRRKDIYSRNLISIFTACRFTLYALGVKIRSLMHKVFTQCIINAFR